MLSDNVLMRKIPILNNFIKRRHHFIIGVDCFLYQNTCMFEYFVSFGCLAYLVFKRTVTFQCIFLRLLNIGQYRFYTQKKTLTVFFPFITYVIFVFNGEFEFLNEPFHHLPIPRHHGLVKRGKARPVRRQDKLLPVQ